MKVFYEFDEGDDDFIRRCFESGVRSYKALEEIADVVRDAGRDIDTHGPQSVDIEEVMHVIGEVLQCSPYSEI